jgi:CDP-diacylglycerol pyrophosphatase
MSGKQRIVWLSAAFALICLAVAYIATKNDGSTLWRLVHEQCLPNQTTHGEPTPCTRVDVSEGEQRGYVILKSRNGDNKYLLIPTASISGVESPALLQGNAPNYFGSAWQSRTLLEAGAQRQLPRDVMSLAVNSAFGRSQEQLHIHIDCLKPEVRDLLRQHLTAINDQWTAFPVLLQGRSYRVMRLHDAELGQSNPFLILADDVRRSLDTPNSTEIATEMGRHTLVLAGITFEDGVPGFILLDDRAELWSLDRGHGEDLQNHSCRTIN